jgi:hypothetical protein
LGKLEKKSVHYRSLSFTNEERKKALLLCCDGQKLRDIYYANQPTIIEQQNEPPLILPQQGEGKRRAAPVVEQYSFQTSRFSVT